MAEADSGLLVLLGMAAFAAGFIDSVVGGGGLIQIPALFTVLPRELPATLFGTNKFASVFGTSNAAWRYARRVAMPWRTTLPAALAAFACSYLGAMAVAWLPRDLLRPLILLLLVGAAIYTFVKKDFGAVHGPTQSGHRELVYATLLGGAIGFYDGFFGPGTGSFFAIGFVALAGFGMARATAHTKLLNFTSNIASLLFFTLGGKVVWSVGLCMALGQFIGARMGSKLVLKKGVKLIKPLLVTVSLVMSAKLVWSQYPELFAWLG